MKVPSEYLAVLLAFMAVFAFWLVPGGLSWARSSGRIPGPSGLPILGLIPAFTGSTTHRVLTDLADSFGAKSLMAFSVGLTRFVISSRPDTAKEILNSFAFADRPVKESAYELLFHRAMGFAPFGSPRPISFPKTTCWVFGLSAQIGMKMVGDVTASMNKCGEVQVKEISHFGSLNNVMMSVFGKSYDFGRDNEGLELEGLVKEGYELLGMFNWSDHLPLLGWLDLQGVRRRCRDLVVRVKRFVGSIVEEHRNRRMVGGGIDGGDGKMGDFVDVLLDLEMEERLSESDMIAVLWEMIFRGTDTIAILLEWILARMVLHPDIQSKVQFEIDAIVGKTRPVSDSDIPNLPYLQSIVKETLRLHPPGPLLSWARLAIHDVHVGHQFVPAGTTAMVNMWAITHDEKVWCEPESFMPERFMEEDVSILGSDLRLAPFGSGRRVCPGKVMGLASVHLWLAQLLQGFKWVPTEGGVDLSECLKMSMEMKKPLVCKAVKRC
ncbi:Cytochrome P450 78A4 [Acorus calamus]|uniref:Cytochrome P450 78A4 n=1 Tax=Acorus calamus TaxID=4465 RepID=A0AAV9E2J1_ACOCL|nr:Cytochrome P450 78A4 [Acorus calamus]